QRLHSSGCGENCEEVEGTTVKRCNNVGSCTKSNSGERSSDTGPPLSALASLTCPGTHLAASHEDTTDGAVHCFQDERGNWFTYTFNDRGVSTAASVVPVSDNKVLSRLLRRTSLQNQQQAAQHSPRNELTNSNGNISNLSCGGANEINNTGGGGLIGGLNRGDTSLSSSSMSLCSGLTVILDNQFSPPKVPWSEVPPPLFQEGDYSSTKSPWSDIGSLPLPPPPAVFSSDQPQQPVINSSSAGVVVNAGLPSLSQLSIRRRGSSPSTTLGSNRGEPGDPYDRPSANNNETLPQVTVVDSSGTSRPARDIVSTETRHHLHLLSIGAPHNPIQLFANALFERRRSSNNRPGTASIITSEAFENLSLEHGLQMDVDMGLSSNKLKFPVSVPQMIQYYKFKIYGNKSIKIKFDRLFLLALLDRNITVLENIICIFLAVLVSIFGCLILLKDFYQELNVFIFCVVMSSCQYSLFKSVQPDAASPTHGYNRIILYSRPVYFCICCSIILLLNIYLESDGSGPKLSLYGINLRNRQLLSDIRDFLTVFILFFPILFSLGLLPQVNTFLMYLLEQTDIHVFGGNATTSLTSAIYCIARSLITILILFGFAYGGLREQEGQTQHILYSIFCGLMVSFCYHLSRSTSDPTTIWRLIQQHVWPEELRKESGTTPQPAQEEDELKDPLPEKLRTTVHNRLVHDAVMCTVIAVVVFAIHSSTVFTVLLNGDGNDLMTSLWLFTSLLGFCNHYMIPQLRKQLPWLCVAHPVCTSHEYSQFEVYDAAKIMWFEKLYVWMCILEKNIVYPVLFLCALTNDAPLLVERFGLSVGTLITVVCGVKCLRTVYSQPQSQYLILAFTKLFFEWDFRGKSETFLVDYFFMNIMFNKMFEFLLKMKFIVTYIAPWQITWGSAFHAFAQPFSVPHSAMLFVQAAVSAILSTPLNPILGSAIFITSYIRPIKFWERDYNTKRVDHSNTRLSSHLERNPGSDDNNLNSIFYEHLTRSLQHSLCGDLQMGRWGAAAQGD
ncbi:unnamed protein product, partial [Meganyctiphanes norvegica]